MQIVLGQSPSECSDLLSSLNMGGIPADGRTALCSHHPFYGSQMAEVHFKTPAAALPVSRGAPGCVHIVLAGVVRNA